MTKSNRPKYCITYEENGDIEYVYIVQEVHGSVYVLEAIPYLWFMIGAAEPSKYPIDIDNIFEKTLKELNNPKFFYEWASVLKEMKEWHSKKDREEGLI